MHVFAAPPNQGPEKRVRAGGRGFVPGITPAKSTRASAPQACFSGISLEIRPSSATCSAPEGCLRLLLFCILHFSATHKAVPFKTALPSLKNCSTYSCDNTSAENSPLDI